MNLPLSPLTIVAVFVLLTTNLLNAQLTTWTDGGGDSSWENPANWSNGIPVTSSAVVFDNPVSVVGVDTGGATTIGSITVNAGTDSFQIVPAFSETLTVNGNFINNSVNTVDISLGYTLGANAIIDGPIEFNSAFNVDLRTATITGTVTLNSIVVLQLNNTTASGYGRFSVGSGAQLIFGGGVGTVRFAPGSTYAGNLGDTFTLISNSGGSVSGLNLSLFDTSTLPTLNNGLVWDTSNLGSGILLVAVPEPSTWGLIIASAAFLMIFCRRRRINA